MPRTTQLARKAAKPAARKAAKPAAPAPAPAKTAKKAKDVPVPEPEEEDEEDEDEDDEEDDDEELLLTEDDDDSDASDSGSEDVSPEGLQALMRALGDDGLDAEDQARLALLRQELEEGAGESESGEDDEDEEEEGSEDDEELDGEELEEEDESDAEEEETELAAPLAVRPPKSKIPGDTLAASLARSGLIPEPQSDLEEEEDEDEEEDEEEEDEDEEDGDANGAGPAAGKKRHPRPSELRPKINNVDAMRRIRADLALDGGSAGSKGKNYLPWIEHMATTYGKSIQEEMGDEPGAADDDLKRELAFYKQALDTAVRGRTLCAQAGVPFARPNDFYAEQVKSDEHMERVRQRLLDESAGIKASEEAKRQRELKKFGKKVQVEKTLERQKSKKDLQERVKGLKRKHQGGLEADDGGDDGFDVRVEQALAGDDGPPRRGAPSGRGRGRGGRAKMPRTARDDKFGFGGSKRYAKEPQNGLHDDGAGRGRGRGRGRGGARGGRGGGRGGSSRGGGAKRPGKDKRTGRA